MHVQISALHPFCWPKECQDLTSLHTDYHKTPLELSLIPDTCPFQQELAIIQLLPSPTGPPPARSTFFLFDFCLF